MVRNERGVALAVAVFALVVIGGLVGGAFFLGMQEQRVGLNTLKHQQAFAAAQEGGQLEVANWVGGSYNAMTVGDSAAFSGKLSNNAGWYRGNVMRLNDMLFIVRTEGFSPDSQTRHYTGLLVRLRPLEVNIEAALKTQGSLKIGGSSYINGHDTPPSGWACGATEPSEPGILINDASQIQTTACSGFSCVDGDPPVAEDPGITEEELTTFGDMTFDDLASMANKVLYGGTWRIEPTVVGGSCATGAPDNWGNPDDPTGPCGSYFPIVYSKGNLNVNGNLGQGVLLVDGNLLVQGGFRFFGPVIVKGTLKTQGTGGHFNGGVIAANVDLDQSTVLGDAVVNFSSCAILKALRATASGALMQERSWVTLY